MKGMLACGLFVTVSACAIVPTTGVGDYNGVPLENRGTVNCANIPGDTSPSGDGARDNLVRCAPQSQTLAGN